MRAILDTSVMIATDVPPLEGNLAIRSRVTDLLIAATAHAHSARLYTRNADDLSDLDQLVEIVRV